MGNAKHWDEVLMSEAKNQPWISPIHWSDDAVIKHREDPMPTSAGKKLNPTREVEQPPLAVKTLFSTVAGQQTEHTEFSQILAYLESQAPAFQRLIFRLED